MRYGTFVYNSGRIHECMTSFNVAFTNLAAIKCLKRTKLSNFRSKIICFLHLFWPLPKKRNLEVLDVASSKCGALTKSKLIDPRGDFSSATQKDGKVTGV